MLYPILGIWLCWYCLYLPRMQSLFYIVFLCFGMVILLLPSSVVAMPHIISAEPYNMVAGSEVSIAGSGFGAIQGSSEVVADYGKGLLYVLKPVEWHDRRIKLKVPDLGRNLRLKLRVYSKHQYSNAVFITIKPDIKPSRQSNLQKTHMLSVGDKGEDIFRISNSPAVCGKVGTVFDHAEIKFNQKRFADAQFIALPKKGCSRCGDIHVRWYNEPTGKLAYRVNIFQRRIEGVCPQRIRHR